MRAVARRSLGVRSGASSAFARRRNEPLDFGDRQDFGQRPGPPRPFERDRRVVAALAVEVKMLVELPDRRKSSRQRRVGETLGAAVGLEGADIGVAGRDRRFSAPGEEFDIGAEVASVGFDGVERRVALGGDRVEEVVDEPRGSRVHFGAFGISMIWVISRGCTCTVATSAYMAP